MNNSSPYPNLEEKLRKFGVIPVVSQGEATPATPEDLEKDASGVTFPNLHRRYETPGAKVSVSANHSFRYSFTNTEEERIENEIP